MVWQYIRRQYFKMPATLFILLLIVSAICGWCIAAMIIGISFSYIKNKSFGLSTLNGNVTGNTHIFVTEVAGVVSSSIAGQTGLKMLLSRHDIMSKLRPYIEQHVDIFLKEKISEAFPLLYKFMGDKTLAKFKDAFLTEVDLLFPELLHKYTDKLLSEVDLKKLMVERIAAMPVDKLITTVKTNAKKHLLLLKLAGAFIGLLAGIIQILLILTLYK